MPRRSSSRLPLTPRRRRGAAVQLILGGLLIMAAPSVLGDTSIGAGFRAMAPVAWLMTVAGAVLLLFLRDARPRVSPKAEARPASGLVPLHPEPVKTTKLARPLARPELDPLDWFDDTQTPRDAGRRG